MADASLADTTDPDASVSVLVVEDEAIVALDLVQMLSKNGYKPVLSCGSSDKAVALAEDQRPDVVLMDIVLRGKGDGVSAASTILERYDIPVVFATSHTDASTLKRALRVSPYGYLVKPLLADEVHSSIQSALRRHGTERRVRLSEARFRAVFDSSPVAIAIYDTDGKLVEANPTFLRMFGVDSVERLLGYSIYDDPRITDDQKREIRERKSVSYSVEVDSERYHGGADIRTKRAGTQLLSVSVEPVLLPNDGFHGYVVQILEI